MRRITRVASVPALFVALLSQVPASAADDVQYTVTNAVTLQAVGRDAQSPTADQPITFGAKLVAAAPVTFDELVFAVRDADDANFDVGDRDGYQLGTSQQTFTATRTCRPAVTRCR